MLNHDSGSAASDVATAPRKKTGSKKGTTVGIKVKLGVFGLTQEISQLFDSRKKKGYDPPPDTASCLFLRSLHRSDSKYKSS